MKSEIRDQEIEEIEEDTKDLHSNILRPPAAIRLFEEENRWSLVAAAVKKDVILGQR